MPKYTIGLDYGTDSVRALIADTATGQEVGTGVYYYPRWKQGKYCAPMQNQFRQHPLDYIEGLEQSIAEALKSAGPNAANYVVGISIDTTGSTPVAVDSSGTPLALLPEFAENPNAMFILWKDHTAVDEAQEINTLARSWGGVNYTKYEGGIYSSEWFWAKLLHVSRADARVREAAYSWVEHCDWIPALLTGAKSAKEIMRSRCAAGHKAMWHPNWGGLPAEEYLVKLDPILKGLRDRLYTDTFTSDTPAGTLSPEWAAKLGLPASVRVGVGAFDAHLGAVGAEIVPYHLSKVMGTSTCDMVVVPTKELNNKLVSGICGQVDGSIIPGMVGLEAGQSAFGDVYAWFRKLLLWPIESMARYAPNVNPKDKDSMTEWIADNLIAQLSEAAKSVDSQVSGVLAIDWLNGRRTPDANQLLTGAITGLNLGSDAPAVFRALVEATAFGARAIVDRFRREGVRIDGVIALGGVAKKSEFVMQIVADVLDMPIRVARSEQACALGTAMAAAVVAGVHSTFEDAQKAMGSGFEREYLPNPQNVAKYNTLYERYVRMGGVLDGMV